MPYIFPTEKHPPLRLPGTTGLGLRPSLACSVGKTVTLSNGEEGVITKTQFYEDKPPKLVVTTRNGEVSEVELKQISEVQG